jgi:acyl-CoA synthetase (AMP-forming)/AMP-acid ligase II
MSDAMAALRAAEQRLLGPGGPFEIGVEDVLGEPLAVFKGRARSLRELLERSATFGDKEYVVYEGRRLSYAAHLRAVASVARALEERFGVGRGDRVAIVAANSPEWVITFWAAASLGAIAVGLNGWWAGDEILYGVADAAPKLLIGDAKRLARLGGSDPGVPVVEIEASFSSLLAHAPDAALPSTAIAEDDPACILYTSGTTGRPKGAVSSHRAILALVSLNLFNGMRTLLAAAEARGKEPAPPSRPPCALVTTPFFHVSGLYTGAVMMLAVGAKMVLRSGRFDPVDAMRLVEREQVTSWGPMGTMAYRVVHHPERHRFDLSSVVQVGSGGSPMHPDLQAGLREAFPSARRSLGLGYGLTESGALATVCSGEELLQHPESVGRPLPTVEIEIRDAFGRPLPEGEEGEIHIRSPLVMLEYWGNSKATQESLLPGRWLRTGDVGKLVEGRLTVNARARDLILRGGENIYPVEIEQRLEVHDDVEEAAVVGVEHEELGQEVKAIVVAAPGREPRPEALAAWVAERLAAFKVPSRWEIRRQPLPRNATGKVLKHVLRGEGSNPFAEE